MRSRVIAAVAVLAVLTTAAVVVGAGRGGRMSPGAPGQCPMGMGGWAKQLNLTPDQMKQLKALHDEFMTATKDTRDQMKTAVKDLVTLWQAPDPDAAQIKAKMADIDSLKTQLRNTGVDYIIKGLNILTPEQRDKVRAMMKNMADKWMEKDGHCLGLMGCGMGVCPMCGGKGSGCGHMSD